MPPSDLRAKMAEARHWRDKRHLRPLRFRIDVLREIREETRAILRGAYGRSIREA